MTWKLADAKNHFDELITNVTTQGPQKIRWRGLSVLVITEAEYQTLKNRKPSFVEHLLAMPKGEPLARMPKSKIREVK